MSDELVQSELSAVNVLLVAIGNGRVNDLDVLNIDVASARVVLADIKQEVLSIGWWFNKAEGFTLYQGADGRVPLPRNTLEVDSTDTSAKYISRAGFLYDNDKQTYTIGKNVEVDILFDLTWDELPRAAYQAVVAQAALEFAAPYELDEIQLKRLTAKALQLGKLLKKSALRNTDTNIFNSQRSQQFLGQMPSRS